MKAVLFVVAGISLLWVAFSSGFLTLVIDLLSWLLSYWFLITIGFTLVGIIYIFFDRRQINRKSKKYDSQ